MNSRRRAAILARSRRLVAMRGRCTSAEGRPSPTTAGSRGGARIAAISASASTLVTTPAIIAARRTRRHRRPLVSRNTCRRCAPLRVVTPVLVLDASMSPPARPSSLVLDVLRDRVQPHHVFGGEARLVVLVEQL